MTVTLDGYIKRTPLATFRAQKRGGKGRAGMATKDEDAVTELFVTSTHNPVLFFSTLGQGLSPEGLAAARRAARTRAAGRWSTCCRWPKARPISTVLPLPEDEDRMGQAPRHVRDRQGTVRRNSMDAFTNIPTAGKIAMRFGGREE